MGRDQKKHQKQKKRERKLLQEQYRFNQVRLSRVRHDEYPDVIIDPNNGDSIFVELIREANSKIRFSDPQMFNEFEKSLYKVLRKHGDFDTYRMIGEFVRIKEREGNTEAALLPVLFTLKYGNLLLSLVPDDKRRQFMPFNDVSVNPHGNQIRITFSSLESRAGNRGKIYFSRRRPIIEFEGKQWVVGFSFHAIQRICERIQPDYTRYDSAGDVFTFFADCLYYEPVLLRGGQPAFLIYGDCGDPIFLKHEVYVSDIFGEENVNPSKGKCYYRVGYCPVIFEDGFAKALTFLYPGYKKTPEYGLVANAQLSPEEKQSLIKQSTGQDAADVVLNDNNFAIKWFHKNGLPQVVQMTREVFDYRPVKKST